MIKAIEKVQRWTAGLDYSQFKSDEIKVAAIATQFMVVGEAVRHVPANIKEKYTNIPWGKMIAMRNFLIHEYDRIDMKTIWDTIYEDLPRIIEPLREILGNETETNE